MPDTDYPQFNEAQPPQQVALDQFPPERTDTQVIGAYTIQPKLFDTVIDPLYRWQDWISYGAAGQRKIKEIKAARDKAVGSYVVTRRRWWERYRSKFYPNQVEDMVVTHKGVTFHHTHTEDTTITQRIGGELGLSLTGNLMDPPPEIPPVVLLARATEETPPPAGDSGLTAQLTWELSKTLHFTTTDEATYVTERTETVTENFRAATSYIWWQIIEQMVVQRVAAGQSAPPLDLSATGAMSRMLVRTPRSDVYAFPPPPAS